MACLTSEKKSINNITMPHIIFTNYPPVINNLTGSIIEPNNTIKMVSMHCQVAFYLTYLNGILNFNLLLSPC